MQTDIHQEVKSRRDRLAEVSKEIEALSEERMTLKKELNALELAEKILFQTIDGPNDTGEQDEEDSRTFTNVIDITRLGFRDAIRHVLKGHPEGMRPRDVTFKLKENNYPYEASTDMNIRVSNELYRMKKAGFVEKNTFNSSYRLRPQSRTQGMFNENH